MKGKLLFGAGSPQATSWAHGPAAQPTKSSRPAGRKLWESKPVQDKVAAAAGAVKEKAPEVSEQLAEAARRAGTVISSAVHRDAGQPNASGGSPADKNPDQPFRDPAGTLPPNRSGYPALLGRRRRPHGLSGRRRRLQREIPAGRPPPWPPAFPTATPGPTVRGNKESRLSLQPAGGWFQSARGRRAPAIAAPRRLPVAAGPARRGRRRGRPGARARVPPAAWCRSAPTEHRGR